MVLSRPLVAEVRRLDESQLRQLLILARGLLLDSEVPVVEIAGLPGMPTVRYRQRSVSCGKDACRACPHGPYWYAHWTEDGRRRSQYIGSELPSAVRRKLEEMDAELAASGTGARDLRGDGEATSMRMATAGGGAERVADGPRLRVVRDQV